MRQLLSGKKRRWIGGLTALVVGVALGGAWAERRPLLAWYYVQRLVTAAEDEREPWVARVAGLDAEVAPRLVRSLTREEPRACANVAAALGRLVDGWGAEDERSADLAGRLAAGFAGFSADGQRCALAVQGQLLARRGKGNPPSVRGGAHLLTEAARVADTRVRQEALDLAFRLAAPNPLPEALGACRELARVCLHDEEPAGRLAAIRLASQPAVNLLEPVVLLLADPVPEVRRAALLVVGSAPEVIATDDLLHWLHDSDPEVRQLCEAALHGRGLRDEYVRLGKLLTDPKAQNRLQVLAYLRYHADLEPGVWLRRLSHDRVAAVRAAAVRAAAEQTLADLSDRIEQMVQNDPSPTVRQVAAYYLACHSADKH
jgi:hypothetical protein